MNTSAMVDAFSILDFLGGDGLYPQKALLLPFLINTKSEIRSTFTINDFVFFQIRCFTFVVHIWCYCNG